MPYCLEGANSCLNEGPEISDLLAESFKVLCRKPIWLNVLSLLRQFVLFGTEEQLPRLISIMVETSQLFLRLYQVII